jgi:uncharacterized membrane protein YdjX (TVP38/TMEM64 family)
MDLKLKAELRTVLFILFILLVSVLSMTYAGSIGELTLFNTPAGKLIYFILTIAGVLAAPFSTIPLLPLASSLWGKAGAIIITGCGWTIGAFIAYKIGERYGRRFAAYFLGPKTAGRWDRFIPGSELFWILVFLRPFVPIDTLSYLVPLLSDIGLGRFLLGTAIGAFLNALIFVYGFSLPVKYQLAIGAAIIGALIINYCLQRENSSGKNK